MLDASIRRRAGGALGKVGAGLHERGVRADAITAVSFLIGVAACAAVAASLWPAALFLWLTNRLLDGVDGATARAGTPTDAGAFFDIMADFAIYGGMLVALAIAEPQSRLAASACLLAYYLNGAAFLAWSSLAAKRGIGGDERGLVFPTGLAEGTETIVVYSIVLVWPGWAEPALWVWAAVVYLSVVQRIAFVRSRLASAVRP